MYAGIGSLLGLRIADLIKEKISPVALFVRDQTRVVFLRTGMDGPKQAAACEAVDRFVQVSVLILESYLTHRDDFKE